MENSEEIHTMETHKEDNDPILEYKNIDTSHLNKFYLGPVAMLAANTGELVAYTFQTMEEMRNKPNGGPYVVLPLDPYRLQWLKRRKKYHPLLKEIFLFLPEGAGLGFLAKAEGHNIPEKTSGIGYTMSLIRLAQAKNFTVFLVGTKDEILDRLVVNLKRSYPQLRLVGKHHGYWRSEGKMRVVEALRKTEPHIILLGIGFHRGLRWIAENRERLGRSVLINLGGDMDVLAGVRKKAPDSWATNGYSWLWRSLHNPLRWYRLFWVLPLYLRALFLILFRRQRKN
ncbi:MAG: WecB/TagA/CpsF family glycosyltransferase [Leptospiraceae bacterium]|nr:WecB/TagA/CpsF family glycosyltransferase [Leptospiraceae bacterium]MDW8305634.1 WecB/TagA/CpsF family glycosyltransferase [Leptospiraceae bacterium]